MKTGCKTLSGSRLSNEMVIWLRDQFCRKNIDQERHSAFQNVERTSQGRIAIHLHNHDIDKLLAVYSISTRILVLRATV